MAVIAEPIAKPVSRFNFFLDRREVLEMFLVAPAIIYVLLLVGLPLLLAVYYSLSNYTVYDPTWKFVGLRNFFDIVQNPTFIQTLVNTLSPLQRVGREHVLQRSGVLVIDRGGDLRHPLICRLVRRIEELARKRQ